MLFSTLPAQLAALILLTATASANTVTLNFNLPFLGPSLPSSLSSLIQFVLSRAQVAYLLRCLASHQPPNSAPNQSTKVVSSPPKRQLASSSNSPTPPRPPHPRANLLPLEMVDSARTPLGTRDEDNQALLACVGESPDSASFAIHKRKELIPVPPLQHPTGFRLDLHSLPSSPSSSTPPPIYLLITATPSFVPFPSLASSPPTVPFTLLLEPVHLGFIPASTLPLVGAIVGLLFLLWLGRVPGRVADGFKWIARGRGEEDKGSKEE
jgi:hypothetical protein